MSVLLVTSLGDIVVDLFVDKCPLTTKNFLKLCKYIIICIFTYFLSNISSYLNNVKFDIDFSKCVCLRIKYYNGCLFHTVQKDFTAQTGDPTGTGTGGDSVYK